MAIDIRRLTRLAIGINTENGVEEYRFDMWPWLEEHPQLNEFQINVTPPGGMPYKAQTHMDGFYLVWPITSRDTALPGDDGWYEVEAFGEGGLHKLSPKKPLVVYERMAGDLGEAPETIKTWVEEAYEVLDSSKTATEAANAAASAANNAAANIKTATNTTLGVVKGGPGILIGEDGRLEGKRPVNLLDNSDFRNGYFIAQAGKNGMHGDTKYAGDRWISWDADAAFSDGYMTPGSPIDQRLPLDRFDLDKIYTVAYCMPDGTIRASSDYLTNGAGSYAFGMHAIAELGYVRVRLMTGFSMRWAAFYEGSYTAETLPEYQPQRYATELVECQRYCLPIRYGVISGISLGTNAQLIIPTPVTMRMEAPTFFMTDAMWVYGADGTTALFTPTSTVNIGYGVRLNGTLGANLGNKPCVVPDFGGYMLADL